MNVIRQAKRGGGNPIGSRPLGMTTQKPKGRGRGASDFDLIQYRPGQRGDMSTSSSGEMRTPSNLQLQMAICSSSAHRTSSSSIQTESGNNLFTPSASGIGHLQHQIHARPSSSSLGGNSSSSAVTPRFNIMGPPKTPRNNLCTPRSSAIVSSASTSAGANSHHSHVVLAITEGRGHARGEVGIAAIDVKRPRLILCQLSDRQTYTNTLTKISVFQPVEILVPHTFVDSNQPNKLYQLLEEKFPFVSMSKVQRRLFRDAEGLEKVQYLCIPENSSCQLILQEKFYALAAAAALFKYVEFVQNVIFAAHSLKVEYQGAHHGTIIDVKTAKNLELLLNQQSNNATHTLISVMNHCCTHGGSRLLRASLLHPPCSLPTITQRQDGVQELVENPDIGQKIREVMQQLPDVEHLLTLCMQTPCTFDSTQAMETRLTYVLMLKTTVEALPLLVAALERSQSVLLCKAKECLQDPRSDLMKTRIIQTLNEDVKAPKGGKTALFQRCFAIKSGINDLMDVARKTYCELINDMHEHVIELGGNHSLPLKMNYSATKGYHIQIAVQKSHPVKKSDLPPLFVQVQQSQNSITCTTDALIHANERIKQVTIDILTMTSSLLTGILNDIREHIGYLYEMCESIAEVDLILALAQTSRSHNYVRPKFGQNLSLKSSRHPILESITSFDPIANDIEATGWQNLSIITGPNMSGKSIYIRQVLLLQIMAQVGCYVPAEEATFRITDRIFSHLNFDDSIENNASTLALEMQEMQLILSSITATSMVALDELCRGTSVEEGTAIAWTICEELSQSTAFVFVTTHFRELTRLTSLYPSIKNVHLETVEHEFSDKKCRLVYTHRLMPGVNPIEDYGLRLAENLNVPASILQMTADFASQIRNTAEVNLTSAQGDEAYALAYGLHKLKIVVGKENFSVDDLHAVQKEIKEAVDAAQQQTIRNTSSPETPPMSYKPPIEGLKEANASQQKLCDYSSSNCDSTFSPSVCEVQKRQVHKSVFSGNPTLVNEDLSPETVDKNLTFSTCPDMEISYGSPMRSTMDDNDDLTSTSTSILGLSFDAETSTPKSSVSFRSQHTWLAESPLDTAMQNRSISASPFPPYKKRLIETPINQSIQDRKISEHPIFPHKRARNYSDLCDSECDDSSVQSCFRLEPPLVDNPLCLSSTLHGKISVIEEDTTEGTKFSSFCVDTAQNPLNDSTGDSIRDCFRQSTPIPSPNSLASNPFHFMKKNMSIRPATFESWFKNADTEETPRKDNSKEQRLSADNIVSREKTLTDYEELSSSFSSSFDADVSQTTPFKSSSLHIISESNNANKKTPHPRFLQNNLNLPTVEATLPSQPIHLRQLIPEGGLRSLMDSYCCSDSDSS